MSSTCALCCRSGIKNKNQFTTIGSVDVEEKIKMTFKNKQSSNQVPNYLSSHRLLLVDRTNYQFSSSTVVTTPSTNEHSQQNFVNLSI
ncbi:unnamed protein product [Rotaria sordida]|uniref:Uncharacterized protein n=1 Tax=Rotaria sordida TaxID=392033 RepID=A0A814VKU3_9BILA|nr:unnamed protein product [Rotaria sordida]CAF3969439.1 unnamed protein product [Rotaria sordida]